MGGSQGKAQVLVKLNDSSVIAGQPISGTVNLILSKSLSDLIVTLKLSGKEVNDFRHNDSRQQGKIKILDYSYVLYNSYGNEVKAGNYSLPFILNTPASVPGTFELKSRAYQAQIVYFLKSDLIEQKTNVGKHKAHLLIRQCINHDRFSMINYNTSNLTFCDCCSRGQSTIQAHLDKNAYLPGETALLSVELDNSRSRGTAKSIIVALFQVTRLISNASVTEVFKKKIFKQKLPVTIVPGEKLLSDKAVSFEIPLVFKKTDLSICGTTDGRLVQCRFVIEVVSEYGGCFSNGPGIDMPIMIFPKELKTVQPSAPEEWNPIEMPLSTIDPGNNYRIY